MMDRSTDKNTEKRKENKKTYRGMICTLFTGQPVRRVFLCVIVMSLK